MFLLVDSIQPQVFSLPCMHQDSLLAKLWRVWSGERGVWAWRVACGAEWSGVEWSGVEWSGVEWSGVEWSGVEWSGVQWSAKITDFAP